MGGTHAMLKARNIEKVFKKHVFKNNPDGLTPAEIQYINLLISEVQAKTPAFEAKDYVISTITTKCQLNININLDEIARLAYLEICKGDQTIHELRYGNQIYNHDIHGKTIDIQEFLAKINRPKTKTKRAKVPFVVYTVTLTPTSTPPRSHLEKNHMGNSITLRIFLKSTGRIINMKLFQNGNITMTGCREKHGVDGKLCVEWLIGLFKDDPSIYYHDVSYPVSYTNYTEIMYNTGFAFRPRINQYKLFQVLLATGLYATYNPEISAPIRVIFMWNDKHLVHDGICKCKPSCIIETKVRKDTRKRYMKKEGDKFRKGINANNCKAITLNIHSQNVIITGDDTIHTIEYIRDFIIQILRTNLAKILHRSIMNHSTTHFEQIPPRESLGDIISLVCSAAARS